MSNVCYVAEIILKGKFITECLFWKRRNITNHIFLLKNPKKKKEKNKTQAEARK